MSPSEMQAFDDAEELDASRADRTDAPIDGAGAAVERTGEPRGAAVEGTGEPPGAAAEGTGPRDAAADVG
jgi:hypothetical protein